jgi:hypothetical protein
MGVMNRLVQDFYQTKDAAEPVFRNVLFLSQSADHFEKLSALSTDLSRGWYELSRLKITDRIEFVRDFWLNMLPFRSSFYLFLVDFFNRLDDLDIVLTQICENKKWNTEMVYSLAGNKSFFRGLPPCAETTIDELRASFVSLPHDYLSFLRIHNGFGKLSELGVLQASQVMKCKEQLTEQFIYSERLLRSGSMAVDPGLLIPFYESVGSYQCFLSDWYPENEMGNVYLSEIDYTISEYRDRKEWADQRAFPAFLDWLAFYLEGNSLD